MSKSGMESFSDSILGRDPVTRRNRTLIGGAILLGGIYYWMTLQHGKNEPQNAKEKAKQEAERIQQNIEDKARRARS